MWDEAVVSEKHLKNFFEISVSARLQAPSAGFRDVDEEPVQPFSLGRVLGRRSVWVDHDHANEVVGLNSAQSFRVVGREADLGKRRGLRGRYQVTDVQLRRGMGAAALYASLLIDRRFALTSSPWRIRT